MTSVLERIIAIIAPHWCIVCGIENNIVCEGCEPEVFVRFGQSCCLLCGRPTVDWHTCQHCKSRIGWLRAATEYEGTAAEIIKKFKFGRARAAAQPLARALDAILPFIDQQTIVAPLPTAPSRVRQRGYDQALLLARELAQLRGLSLATPLLRQHDDRQVGADRTTRYAQAKTAYALGDARAIKGRPVLVVDDICTTGASLNVAAKLLHKAGASEVNAAVVAWQRLK